MTTPANGEAARPKNKRGCLKGCLATSLVVFTCLILVVCLIFPGVHYIGWRPQGEPYDSTEFEFRFGDATRFVSDPGNHMQWVFGDLPDSITVTNRTRLIVYNEPKAVMKSWGDSMDVQIGSLKHKGYMGIWDNGTHFVVDSDGVVQAR